MKVQNCAILLKRVCVYQFLVLPCWSLSSALQEASNCLQQHAVKIKHENRELRQELLHLIGKTRALHKHKLELEEQKKTLVRERQYADNLGKMKLDRDKKMYKTFGLTSNNTAPVMLKDDVVSFANDGMNNDGIEDNVT